MLRRNSTSGGGGPTRKPRADVYTMLLLLALGAVIIACLLLYLDVKHANGTASTGATWSSTLDAPEAPTQLIADAGEQPFTPARLTA